MDASRVPVVCTFGHFDPQGGRYWALARGLEENGCTVIQCRTDARGAMGKYRDLLKQWRACRDRTDVLFVPFLGQYLLPLAWVLARRRRIPLVADAFLSLYDTDVHDRRRLSRFDPRAWLRWILDWLACRLPDITLIDTQEYAAYFAETFGADARKMLPVPIGCRADLFRPLPRRGQPPSFTVAFHGTFIPLQGIETILEAARLLQDQREPARFLLMGKGQTYPAMRRLAEGYSLRNVTFIGTRPMEEIPQFLADADVCLGIFGTTAKAARVIPTKAYEILSCGKPLITGDTPAARRVLENGTNALLSRPGDGKDLAEKILLLRRDGILRQRLAESGLALSRGRFQPGTIASPLVHWIRSHG